MGGPTAMHGHAPLQVRVLKAGGFGTVALAEDRVAGSQVALKFIPRCQVGTTLHFPLVFFC